MMSRSVSLTRTSGTWIAVERFVLEYADCPAVFEILAKETEDAGFWQLGFSQHADHLGRDLLGGCEFSRGGGL